MNRPAFFRHRPARAQAARFHLGATALACALASASLLAPPARAQAGAALSAQRSVALPAQPLGQSLNALARLWGVAISADATATEGRAAPAVTGTLSLAQALERVLAGSGLVAVPSGAAIAVQRQPATGATLAPVTVRANLEPESATGPLRGYAATRSTSGSKTDTPLVEIPQSISIVGAQEIETLKALNLQDALNYVAGVSRQEGLHRTGDVLWIRGFQSSTDQGSMYRDGTKYAVNSFNGQQEVYGLERIELLKGAASVLYGSAAPGGVINTVTKRPTTTPLHEINLEAGSFGRRQVSGDFAGALGTDGDWSYRFTFLQRASDTFVDHVPDDRSYIAPALKWQPSAATALTLLAEYHKDRTVYVDGLPAQGTVLPNPNGRLSRSRFTGEPGFDRFELERYGIGYLFEHAFDERFTLRNTLRYQHAENAYNYTWGWGLSADQRSTAARGASERWDRSSAVVSDTSLQYRVRHGAVQHTALVGLDYSAPRHSSERYSRSVANLDLYAPVYGSPLGAPTPNSVAWRHAFKRLGLYAQDQMKLADRWVVLLGARYDQVRYDESEYFSGAPIADGEKSHALTGRAGLVYLADNGLAPFLSWSESFEPTAGRDRQGRRFAPTTGRQLEAGLRYQPAGAQTLLSATVYQLTRENGTVTDPQDSSFLVQMGRVRSRGFEFEARTRVGRHGNLIAAYAYTDARTLQASPLQPELAGMRTNSVPYNQLSLWGDYGLDALGLPGVRLGAGLRHVDETRGMAQGTAVAVPAFTLFDAMLSYTTGPWKLALNVSNLADRNYVASCTFACFFGEPRKAIVTASYRW
jgi:iron complex outermembrane receptor protein